MSDVQPALFLGHGSPMLAIEPNRYADGWRQLGRSLPRPRAILAVSAHWYIGGTAVTAQSQPRTIHDFYGFPPALYELSYPAPGAPELAERISDLLCDAGLQSTVDRRRGLDHGAWVPLMLGWPEADIPVLQLSIQSHLGPAHHVQLGRALAPLREEDVLIIGSGSFTHDLRRFRGQALDAPEAPDVAAFSGWMDEALRSGRSCDLVTYRHKAPYAVAQHPTEEHLLPLFVALGAGTPQGAAERLHSSAEYGVLRMDTYAFH